MKVPAMFHIMSSGAITMQFKEFSPGYRACSDMNIIAHLLSDSDPLFSAVDRCSFFLDISGTYLFFYGPIKTKCGIVY